MATFILVPGGWSASWVYKNQVDVLEAAGHTVIALDCPGHGNNKEKYKPGEEGLAEHVQCIKDALPKEGKAILVAHSMTGMAISQVAEDCPDKVEKLVYLAAFMPEADGVAMIKYMAEDPWTMISPESVNTEVEPDEELNRFESLYLRNLAFGTCSDEAWEFALTHLEDEGDKIWSDPVHISRNFALVPKIYVHTLKDNCCSYYIQRVMVARQPVVKEYYLDTDHFCMLSDPEGVNKILLEVAETEY